MQYLQDIFAFLVAVALFVATTKYYPVKDSGQAAKKEKFFWAIVFFVLSSVVGILISNTFSLRTSVNTITAALADRADLLEAARGYSALLDGDSHEIIEEFATDSLQRVTRTLQDGYLPVHMDIIFPKIGELTSRAKDFVVAVNVGSTEFFFDNANYLQVNHELWQRGVPVIRFFLFSSKQRILGRGGKTIQNIDDFVEEVREIHANFRALYSVVIDVDKAANLKEVRDILFIDRKFGLMARFSSAQWGPYDWAQATDNKSNIDELESYIKTLVGYARTPYVVAMEDDNVRRQFSRVLRSYSVCGTGLPKCQSVSALARTTVQKIFF